MSLSSITKRFGNRRVVGSIIAILALAFAYFGVAGSLAAFSDSKDGRIDGSIGSVRLATSGGIGADGLNFTFNNLMPGEPQSVTANFQNTGSGKEDVYLTFPNATALSALNTLGTYGEFHVAVNGTEIFASANLNDRSSTCGAFSSTGCWPVPSSIKLADDIDPGVSGTVTITFGYASKLQTQAPDGTTGVFNTYPVADQTTVNASDGTGNGLPLRLTATQANAQQP